MEENILIEIRECRGVCDAAMASMLHLWIISFSAGKIHPDFSKVNSLMKDFHLTIQEIEKVCESVADAIHGNGLWHKLTMEERSIDNVNCKVKTDIAMVKLEWK